MTPDSAWIVRSLALIPLISLSALPASANFCYMTTALGQTVNLDNMCGDGPTDPIAAVVQQPSSPIATPELVSETPRGGYWLERSTRDLVNSNRNSWVRLRNVQLQDGYLIGIAFNQGELPAENVRIDYELLDANRNVVESSFNGTQIDTLAPQQQQEFRIPVGYYTESTPRAEATWQEWVEE